MTIHEKLDYLMNNSGGNEITYTESSNQDQQYTLEPDKKYMFVHCVCANGFGDNIASYTTDGATHINKKSGYADGIGYTTITGVISNATYIKFSGVGSIRQTYNIVYKL